LQGQNQLLGLPVAAEEAEKAAAEKAAEEPFLARHPVSVHDDDRDDYMKEEEEEEEEEEEAFAEGIRLRASGEIKLISSQAKRARGADAVGGGMVGGTHEEGQEGGGKPNGKQGYAADSSAATTRMFSPAKHFAAHKLGHGASATKHVVACKLEHCTLETKRREALLKETSAAEEAANAKVKLTQWRRDRLRRERQLEKAERRHEQAVRDATERRKREEVGHKEEQSRREVEHAAELGRLAEEHAEKEEAYAREVQRSGEDHDARVTEETQRQEREVEAMQERMQEMLGGHSEEVRRLEQQFQLKRMGQQGRGEEQQEEKQQEEKQQEEKQQQEKQQQEKQQEEEEQEHEAMVEGLRRQHVERVSALHAKHSRREQELEARVVGHKHALQQHVVDSAAREKVLREEISSEAAELQAAGLNEADRAVEEIDRKRKEHEETVEELTVAWKQAQHGFRALESDAIDEGVRLEADAQRQAEKAEAARVQLHEAAVAAAEAKRQAEEAVEEAARLAALPTDRSVAPLAAFMVQMPIDARPGSIMLVQVPGGGDLTMQVRLPSNVPPGQCFSVMPPGAVEEVEAAKAAGPGRMATSTNVTDVGAQARESVRGSRWNKKQPAHVLHQWYRFVLSRLVHVIHVRWHKQLQRAWGRWVEHGAAHTAGIQTLFKLWPRLRIAFALVQWKKFHLGYRIAHICDRVGLEVRLVSLRSASLPPAPAAQHF
jgi:hypothetical protein